MRERADLHHAGFPGSPGLGEEPSSSGCTAIFNAGVSSSLSMPLWAAARGVLPGRGYQAKAFPDAGRVQLSRGDGHGEVECLAVT